MVSLAKIKGTESLKVGTFLRHSVIV